MISTTIHSNWSPTQALYHDLATRFVQLRAELDTPFTRDASSTDRNSTSRARQRHKASNDFDTLLVEIRKQEGFDDFLLAPNEGSMRAAASHGPIIIINVSDHRCDAILVEQRQIRSLALLNLHRMDIEKKKEEYSLGNPRILEWLWDVIAKPILDALGFVQPPLGNNWPHIWWIPTPADSASQQHL